MRQHSLDMEDKILAFISREIRSKGYPPSVREIGETLGIKSTASVHAHLRSMEKRGVIRRDPTKPRALKILGAQQEAYSLCALPLPESLFALCAPADGAPVTGVLAGDRLIAQHTDSPKPGDFAVLRQGDAVLVRPIKSEDDFATETVLGVLVGFYRPL